MAEHKGGEAGKELKRLPVTDLAYPVLLLQRESFSIWRDERPLREFKGLLVDRHGMSYHMVECPDPFWRDGRPLPRAERLRILELQRAGHALPRGTLVYTGEPVQLSVDRVRDVLLANGWDQRGIPRRYS